VAGDWIKMRTELQTHPKVRRIASALHADKFRTIGGLHAVWSLFDAHSVDGSLECYTPEDIDSEIGFPGFARAMESVEWLDVRPDRLCLPEFDEHNGQSAKRRAEDQKRKRRVRNPSAPEADKKRTREEKRREEKETLSNRVRAIDVPFIPGDSVKRWAAEKFPSLDFEEEVAAFVDHHTAKGSVFKDWDAAVRSWLRHAGKWNRDGTPPRRPANRKGERAQVEPEDAEMLRRDAIREAAHWLKSDESPEAKSYLGWLAPSGQMRSDAMTFDEWKTREKVIA